MTADRQAIVIRYRRHDRASAVFYHPVILSHKHTHTHTRTDTPVCITTFVNTHKHVSVFVCVSNISSHERRHTNVLKSFDWHLESKLQWFFESNFANTICSSFRNALSGDVFSVMLFISQQCRNRERPPCRKPGE